MFDFKPVEMDWDLHSWRPQVYVMSTLNQFFSPSPFLPFPFQDGNKHIKSTLLPFLPVSLSRSRLLSRLVLHPLMPLKFPSGIVIRVCLLLIFQIP